MAEELDLEKLQEAQESEETVIEPDLARMPGRAEQAPNQNTADKKLQINVSRYTKEEFARAFPDRAQDWEKSMHPHALNLFVSNMLLQMLQAKVRPARIRVVVLDEEYKKWQEENGRENTQETRSEYCRSVSAEDALRLLKKNHMEDSIEFLALPVALTGTRREERTLYLRKSVAEELQTYLAETFGEGNVYVPRYIMSLEAGIGMQHDFELLHRAAAAWFMDGIKDAVPELKNQKLVANRSLCYIPIAVRINHKSADFPMDTVSREETAEFNPVILLGEKRKTASLPFLSDLANIDGYPVAPAPEILGMPLLYQQMGKLQQTRMQNARAKAREDIRSLRETKK